MRTFVLSSALLLLTTLLGATNYSAGDQLHVVAPSGLNMRDAPGTHGQRVGQIPWGETVTVINTLGFADDFAGTFESFDGHWVQVRYQDWEGYVFDAYLSQFPIITDLEAASAEYDGAFSDFDGMYDFWPLMLRAYAEQGIGRTGDPVQYLERGGGEMAHVMVLQNLRNDHLLVEHGYWEGSSAELQLRDVRNSEVYFLVMQLVEKLPNDIISLDEGRLKNIVYGDPWEHCAGQSIPDGECLVSVVRKSH
ncbi:MAG: SH3 domain-containing protein, partial [Lewinella sp.]|nr:SH3 domain-containing protein [Lewinella sp.]